MGVGGKKAKSKGKNGQAATMKQRVKKTKSAAMADEETATESSAPGSSDLAVQDQEVGEMLDFVDGRDPATVESNELCPASDDNEQPDVDKSPSPEASQEAVLNDLQSGIAGSSEDEDAPETCTDPEQRHSPRREASPMESRGRSSVASLPAPISPVPALVRLPSPSLTETRFMSNPTPDAHLHYPSPPPFHPYAPHCASPYASPYASPVPKISSPLARSHYPFIPPAMSPMATPPPPPALPAPMVPMSLPPTAQGFDPRTHSPVMSTAGMLPACAPYPPYPPPNGHFIPHGYSTDSSRASSVQAIRSLSVANDGPHENGVTSPSENDNEHFELLQRIQAVMPDIDRLMHGFRNTHTKLSSREAEIEQLGSQHEQALMHKDFYIEALQAQMKKAANESAEECTKLKHTINELRLELGNLQERHNDLEDDLAEHQSSNEALSQTKTDLEAEIVKLNNSIQEARDAYEQDREDLKENHTRALATQKQELTDLFEEIRNEDEKAAAEAVEAREKELLSQQESLKEEWEKEKASMQQSLETHRSELAATKAELASKITALESKDTELSSKSAELASTRDDVALRVAELEAKGKELEQARTENLHALETLQQRHSDELDALRLAHDAQLAADAREFEEKVSALEAKFDEKEHHWTAERATLENLVSEKDSELVKSEREKEKLEGDGLLKEQQLQRAVDQMRSTIDHLDRDCDRLRKTLHSLGEATDLKSTKGDQFFSDCFEQLSHLIHELCKEHFAYLPIDPPKDILSKIPSELPSFLDNTPASRELRCAYIQQVVSKTITYRVFQPFLFTLGRRYDKADTFLQMLSMDIRRKSVRREAFWRQQTLKAAYTTSDAKQSINVAAAVIVDEIIDQIKHFADPKQLDSLLTGVRKIVKLAAETWRHARVERELILAAFPAPDAESAANEEWQEHGVTREDLPDQKHAPSRQVVLRTFPRILREAAHEDFASGERASSCVYCQGEVLFADSPVVVARLHELAQKPSKTINVVVEETPLSPPETPPKSPEESDDCIESVPVKGVEKLARIDPPSVTLRIHSAPTSPKA